MKPLISDKTYRYVSLHMYLFGTHPAFHCTGYFVATYDDWNKKGMSVTTSHLLRENIHHWKGFLPRSPDGEQLYRGLLYRRSGKKYAEVITGEDLTKKYFQGRKDDLSLSNSELILVANT